MPTYLCPLQTKGAQMQGSGCQKVHKGKVKTNYRISFQMCPMASASASALLSEPTFLKGRQIPLVPKDVQSLLEVKTAGMGIPQHSQSRDKPTEKIMTIFSAFDPFFLHSIHTFPFLLFAIDAYRLFFLLLIRRSFSAADDKVTAPRKPDIHLGFWFYRGCHWGLARCFSLSFAPGFGKCVLPCNRWGMGTEERQRPVNGFGGV